jgi:hypothetical protein
MILSIAGLSSKSLAARSASELTDGDGNAIEDRQRGIMRQALAQPLSQLIFESTEISSLPGEGCAMETAKARKEVAPVSLKIGKERAVLIQTQVLAHDFHGQHFTVG